MKENGLPGQEVQFFKMCCPCQYSITAFLSLCFICCVFVQHIHSQSVCSRKMVCFPLLFIFSAQYVQILDRLGIPDKEMRPFDTSVPQILSSKCCFHLCHINLCNALQGMIGNRSLMRYFLNEVQRLSRQCCFFVFKEKMLCFCMSGGLQR